MSSHGSGGPTTPSTPTPRIPIIIKKPFGGTNSPSPLIAASVGIARRPGIFPSIRYGQQVISTGIQSLDSYIGNGYPVNSIVVLKNVFPSNYADMILKCFIAEGATYNHHIFIKSGGTSLTSSAFSKQLPSLVPRSSDSSFQQSSTATREEVDNLKIAWRYKDSSPLPATLSTRGNALVKNKGHNQKLSATTKFEFTKKCSVEDLGGQRLTISHDDEEESFSPAEASANSNILLREIIRIAKEFEPVKKPNSFLRIALSHCENELTPDFMTSLRAIVRHTDSCVVLTISDLQDIELRLMIEHFADYVIEFQSILDEVKKKQLGGIDGLCEIKKMNSFNSIKPIEKPKDLGFSFHKKRFVFQELHLQPEDETTAQREVTSKSKTISSQESSSSSSCGGSTIKGKSIDF